MREDLLPKDFITDGGLGAVEGSQSLLWDATKRLLSAVGGAGLGYSVDQARQLIWIMDTCLRYLPSIGFTFSQAPS
jgi:hypothetical protein